jgi:signal peptidase I
MNQVLKFEKIADADEIQKNFQPSLIQELREYFWYFLRLFSVIFIIYFITRTTLFDLIGVRGQSMFPTFNENTTNDAIYIDKLTTKFSDYRRGDVIVLVAPEKCVPNSQKGKPPLYIKRVIGLPGEQVAFENGDVYIINKEYPAPGIKINESAYLKDTVPTYKNIVQDSGSRYEEIRLGPNQYYFLGDNRTGSSDSRVCGPISKELILGREFFRFSPEEKRGFFKLPKYNISNQ